MFLATSDIHLQYKLRITRDECVAQARDSVRFAKSLCEDVEFSPEDATRTDPEFSLPVLEAVVEAGATTLNIPDTVGYTIPAEFGDLIRNHPPARDAESRSVVDLRPLPQRSRTGGGQFPGRRRQRARARSNAPSTASASAPAMRHWKKL